MIFQPADLHRQHIEHHFYDFFRTACSFCYKSWSPPYRSLGVHMYHNTCSAWAAIFLPPFFSLSNKQQKNLPIFFNLHFPYLFCAYTRHTFMYTGLCLFYEEVFFFPLLHFFTVELVLSPILLLFLDTLHYIHDAYPPPSQEKKRLLHSISTPSRKNSTTPKEGKKSEKHYSLLYSSLFTNSTLNSLTSSFSRSTFLSSASSSFLLPLAKIWLSGKTSRAPLLFLL